MHFSDEMRLGLRGQTRRVLARRGVKPVQRLQLRYEWAYLLLAVLREWALGCVVWDGAPAHKARVIVELPTARVPLPPYSPELNPAERIFEELRRHVEDRVYDDLKAKREEAEVYLKELGTDPERVTSLCGWGWIRQSLQAHT